MIAVVVLRYQRPVRVVEPQVRVGRELVASGVTVAVDDRRRRVGDREVEVRLRCDRVRRAVRDTGREPCER